MVKSGASNNICCFPQESFAVKFLCMATMALLSGFMPSRNSNTLNGPDIKFYRSCLATSFAVGAASISVPSFDLAQLSSMRRLNVLGKKTLPSRELRTSYTCMPRQLRVVLTGSFLTITNFN